jgi:hypothetical protein
MDKRKKKNHSLQRQIHFKRRNTNTTNEVSNSSRKSIFIVSGMQEELEKGVGTKSANEHVTATHNQAYP